MTVKKRFRKLAGLLAVVLCLTSMPIVASAESVETNDDVIYGDVVSVEEMEDGITAITYEFDVDPSNPGNPVAPDSATLALDSTFTMSGTYHRGGDRAFAGNFITYSFTISDTNGNAVNQSVTIEMYDYYHSGYLRSHTLPADAGLHIYTMNITPYRYYYFKYYRASSSVSLKIRLVVYVETV